MGPHHVHISFFAWHSFLCVFIPCLPPPCVSPLHVSTFFICKYPPYGISFLVYHLTYTSPLTACLRARTTCPHPSDKTKRKELESEEVRHNERKIDRQPYVDKGEQSIGNLVAQHVDVSLLSVAYYAAHQATCILHCNVDFSMLVS